MTEQVSPTATFCKNGWERYQQALTQAIAPLSSEQLALSVAPHYMPIRDLLTHMLGARANWFSGWMGEENAATIGWGDESYIHEAHELVTMFEGTWRVISSNLDRWTPADLEQLFQPPAYYQAQGWEEPAHTREWIIWHTMEHEIHHGGELSLALGTHDLGSFYTW